MRFRYILPHPPWHSAHPHLQKAVQKLYSLSSLYKLYKIYTVSEPPQKIGESFKTFKDFASCIKFVQLVNVSFKVCKMSYCYKSVIQCHTFKTSKDFKRLQKTSKDFNNCTNFIQLTTSSILTVQFLYSTTLETLVVIGFIKSLHYLYNLIIFY